MKRIAIIIFVVLASIVYGARDFDGATDRIDYAAPLNAKAQAQTFSCWAWIDNFSTDHSQYLFTEHTEGTPDAWANIFYISWADPNWNLSFLARHDGVSSLLRLSNNDPFTLGAWHNLLFTWDGSTTAANSHIYVDGSEVSYLTTTNGVGNNHDCNGPWALGARNENDIRNMDGRMAAVGWWNRVLGAGEITSLAKGYSPLFIPNGLKFAPDLVRSYFDPISGAAGTLDGTSVIAHPRIIYPSKIWTPHKAD